MAESLCRRSSGSKNKELDDAFIAWDELCKLQAKHRFRDMRLGCRVVYINLDRDTHRRENFERCAQDANVKVCRMSGIDGATHDFTDAEIALFEKSDFQWQECKGVAACALSHLRAWEAFLFTDDQCWIVCEDDIEVHQCMHDFEYDRLPRTSLTWLYHTRERQETDDNLVPMRTPKWFGQGSAMYALTRSAAAFLIDTVYWEGFFRAVDWVMIDKSSYISSFLHYPICGTLNTRLGSTIEAINMKKDEASCGKEQVVNF